MANQNYAVIKDGVVVNVLAFNNPSRPLLQQFISHFSADDIILCEDPRVIIGNEYVDEQFIYPQPFPSWVWDKATAEWQAPLPMPNDRDDYVWQEDTSEWVLPIEFTE